MVLLGALPVLCPADLPAPDDGPLPAAAGGEGWVVIDRLPEEGFFLQAEDFEVRRLVLRSVEPASEATWAQKCLVASLPLPLLRRCIHDKLDESSLLSEACGPPGTRFNWYDGRTLDGKELAVHLRGQKLYVHVSEPVGTIPVEVRGEVRVSFRHGKGTLFPAAAASPWAPAALPPVGRGRRPLWYRR